MFDLDGRHFMSAVGKDYLDHLFAQADAGMIRVSLDTDDRLVADENRLTAIEGRVDVVRREVVRSDQRVDVVVARSAEEGDAIINER